MQNVPPYQDPDCHHRHRVILDALLRPADHGAGLACAARRPLVCGAAFLCPGRHPLDRSHRSFVALDMPGTSLMPWEKKKKKKKIKKKKKKKKKTNKNN